MIVTTAILSMIAATSFAADKTDDNTLYMGLNNVPIYAEIQQVFKDTGYVNHGYILWTT